MISKVVGLVIFLLVIIHIVKCQKEYEFDGIKYYSSYPSLEDWFGARTACMKKGMMLVDVESEEENSRLISIIEAEVDKLDFDIGQYWTSGSNLGQDGYYWSKGNDRQPFNYTNWADDQPALALAIDDDLEKESENATTPPAYDTNDESNPGTEINVDDPGNGYCVYYMPEKDFTWGVAYCDQDMYYICRAIPDTSEEKL